MYVILGATGHVGSAAADDLIRAGKPVTVVTRDEEKAASWQSRGAEAAVLDVTDVNALRSAFKRGRRAFLLNPPAPPSTSVDQHVRVQVRHSSRSAMSQGATSGLLESQRRTCQVMML